jgi:GntR family transcriptional regulator, negative regulator for fad regulon and positive regulator of fabA
MDNWQPIPRPAEIAEQRLLEAILSGHFAINSSLPGERDLAAQVGVTRPTLREALQRLARDGWLEIQQGKPTRVRDYWHEGNLAVLATLAQSDFHQPADFIAHLLEIRLLLAPAYARQAVQAAAGEIAALLGEAQSLADMPSALAHFDWKLHSRLTRLAANPVFPLLMNGFEKLYVLMGERYFAFEECRVHSREFYARLQVCAQKGDAAGAETILRETMLGSLALWERLEK